MDFDVWGIVIIVLIESDTEYYYLNEPHNALKQSSLENLSKYFSRCQDFCFFQYLIIFI